MNRNSSSPTSGFPVRSPSFRRRSALLAAVLTLALALASFAVAVEAKPSSGSGGRAARVTISAVSVKGATVTVGGRVTLPVNTAAERRRTRVLLTLRGTGKPERLVAKLDARCHFTATKRTQLTGALTVLAAVRIGATASGRPASKRFQGPRAAGGGSDSGGESGSKGGGGRSSSPVAPPGAQQLIGLLKLDPGNQAASGALSGTYFQMIGVVNADSTALDKRYTLLRPGTDGGLRTDAYQLPPVPAFAGSDPVSHQPNGDALASSIVLPQTFFQIKFSIVTAPVDPQAGVPDPLPVLYVSNGKITGQLTDWNAQWNGLSFNQGSPKPAGTGAAAVAGTTDLTGTLDAASSHFVITWRSYIEGGPFGGFTGEWHLEGTYVPAA